MQRSWTLPSTFVPTYRDELSLSEQAVRSMMRRTFTPGTPLELSAAGARAGLPAVTAPAGSSSRWGGGLGQVPNVNGGISARPAGDALRASVGRVAAQAGGALGPAPSPELSATGARAGLRERFTPAGRGAGLNASAQKIGEKTRATFAPPMIPQMSDVGDRAGLSSTRARATRSMALAPSSAVAHGGTGRAKDPRQGMGPPRMLALPPNAPGMRSTTALT